MKKLAFALIFIFTSIDTYSSNATGELVSIPTGWRVDNKADGSIEVYYSNSTCIHGLLNIDSSANEGFKNRFTSILLTTKLSQSKIQVFYEANDNKTKCYVTKISIPNIDEQLFPL